ncbi:hypothetical protein Hypma_008788 [Hypsizygus marmoreus]|uniref:Uncharacterized protein n=1 Tax=Hypsizygus marmoreus TaxID=39966 RepID=A0A369JQL9_HYPMA|nr:hypothetical protein Hypma_008788 [Hypsizygus marmoreus]
MFPRLKVQLSRAGSKRRSQPCDLPVTSRSKTQEEKRPKAVRSASQAETRGQTPHSESAPAPSRNRKMSLKRLWGKQPPADRETRDIDGKLGAELSYLLGIDESGSVHSVAAKRYARVCRNPEKRRSSQAEVIDPFMKVQHGSSDDTPSFFSRDAMESRSSVSSGPTSAQQSLYIF